MATAFQSNAFQNNAFQIDAVVALATAFQSNAFQNNAFQIDVVAAVAAVTGGKGDNERGPQQVHLPFKPTGLLDRPLAKTPRVQERLDEQVADRAEIAARLAREFAGEITEQPPVERMSLAEVDREIGILLRKKLRTEEEQLMLLLLMAASA